ncbi:chemosensory receptor C [Elysia marginata]|uniref:Chemosensory receptor C n=1 Tax=Elysia marginata TaxID=1093978 RepID=A0AAV4IEQ0_9GAST|nr:chemosensory receptor C [Elysia marginata]
MASNFIEIVDFHISQNFMSEVLVMRKFILHMFICMTLLGVISNSINILVFVKLGLKDNVTITLLFLSLSDLMYLLLYSPTFVLWFLAEHHPHIPLPSVFNIFLFVPSLLIELCYDYSALVSVFMAVVRCACVARPLKFKAMFTKSRTLFILGVLFSLNLVFFGPSLIMFRLVWAVNPNTNSTFLALEYSDNFSSVRKVLDFYKNIHAWLTYITVVACTAILAYKLQAASRFRRSLASAAGSEKVKTVGPISTFSKTRDASSCPSTLSEREQKQPSQTSTKELQVIRSVTLICVIYILSVLPTQVNTCVRLLDPKFYDHQNYVYTYTFAGYIATLFHLFNASVNIFVHYHFNSRYREKFLHSFYLKR